MRAYDAASRVAEEPFDPYRRAVTVDAHPAIDIRSVGPDELEAWFAAVGTAFFVWPWDPPAMAEYRRDQMEPGRTLAAFEGPTIVGTHRSFGADLTLPGGTSGQLATVPVGCVTGVTVRPSHRRRGILSRLVAQDLRASVERGEAADVLISAEYPIYGRFGYGHATEDARYSIRARHLRFRGGRTGSIEIVGGTVARDVVADVYERYRVRQPGELSRPVRRFDEEVGLVEPPRGRWKGHVAIHRDVAGTSDGYVRYRGEEHWDEGIPDNTLIVDELHGVTPEAELEVWRFLADVDLVETITAHGRRIDEPLRWAAIDARAVRITFVQDMLWLRPVDLARLLGERAYEREGHLILDVVDMLPNGEAGPCQGRWDLEASADGARCRRTTDAADLTVSVSALGAASLGGTRLVDAVRASGVDEHTPGALMRADALLRTANVPWCSTYF